jgi:hypothetical protein
MNSRLSKSSILHACITKQQLTISDFEKEVARLRTEVTTRDESASQGGNGATEQNDLLVRMEHELLFLRNELMTLENIDAEAVCVEIEAGAVVVTDQRVFFVSTSIESVDVNDHPVFGLSLHAPIYSEMKGKKKGDLIEYNGLRYKILDVY